MKSLLMYINKEKQANGRKSPSGNDESKLSFRFLRSKKVVRGLLSLHKIDFGSKNRQKPSFRSANL